MKVVISAGGRFHALELAQQLHHRHSLTKLISFSYTKNNQSAIPKQHLHTIKSCAFLDYLFTKLRLGSWINASSFNHIKDNLFDIQAAQHLKNLPPFDIFVGWAHYARKSIPIARSKGARIIIESGSSHIQTQQALLIEEYNRWNVPFKPINPNVIEKMVQEYSTADYIMTLSSISKKSFIDHNIPEQKILCAPCGTRVDYFLTPPLTYKKPQTFRVLMVGLLNIRKGIPYLLHAWKKAALPQKNTELILVGVLQKDLAGILSQLPISSNVTFYGSTSPNTLKQLYYESSLFILPSIEDGFGMVVGEAMACGLPIICTSNTGVADIITHKKNGFIVPAGDIQQLVEKIVWCYEHQEEATIIGRAGKQHIQNYTWNNYGHHVFQLYQKIMMETT